MQGMLITWSTNLFSILNVIIIIISSHRNNTKDEGLSEGDCNEEYIKYLHGISILIIFSISLRVLFDSFFYVDYCNYFVPPYPLIGTSLLSQLLFY